MSALLGDMWLYVFTAGFAVFGTFFLYALKKYRGIGRPALDGLLSPLVDSSPVEPVRVVPAAEATTVLAESEEKTSPGIPRTDIQNAASRPAVAPSTGAAQANAASSPAVVYLKNLKLQMETFEEEIHQLRSQVVAFAQKHDQQFDALLARMGQLQSELHDQVREYQQPAAAMPQAAPAPASEPTEPTVVIPPSKAKKTSPEEIFSAEDVKNMKLEPPPAREAAPPAKTPPAAQATQPVEEEDILKPKGKGPVWPV